MKKFKEFIIENNELSTHTDLVKDFYKTVNANSYKNEYAKRDNCGLACIDFESFAKHKGISLTRVRGHFKGDKVVHDKADFTPEMKKEFSNSGLNFNNKEHRRQWIESNPKYSEEWKKIPHYWTIDEKGKIHDPSGHLQIIKQKFSSDLHPSRYEPE